MLAKIVSGGQSGTDRGALDAALAAGFPCGGWCPAGRAAEDGRIPDIYPLTEVPQGGYRARTLQNAIDSDGTVILYFDSLEGGTQQTFRDCVRLRKPCERIDGARMSADYAARMIDAFVTAYAIRALNVAGPRASKEPRAYAYARDVVNRVIALRGPTP